jgi:predicted dehydrogenase
MNQTDTSNPFDFNRRDFLRTGSMATLMTMLGGVELIAQTNAPAEPTYKGPKVKVAVVGLGPWGREILNTLARMPMAEVAAVCDSYAASLRRGATAAPGAKAVDNFQAILDDKAIKCVVISTPTHQHRPLVEAALKAGKHVYCEAPLAHTLEDAKAIAAAVKASPQCLFQAGLHMRSDKQRLFMLPFIRSGALGRNVFARAQWHKKQSWRATSPNPEREKEVNWRLSQETSLGLAGEIGIHQIDQACWYFNTKPKSVTAFGGNILWQDGRDVQDSVQAMIEFPGNVQMIFDASLANSFDADYEMLYGSDAAVMMRGSKAWMFKEVDSPLLGWEVYAQKETFYKETGIALVAGGSKSVNQVEQQAEVPFTNTPLSYSLTNFLRNSNDLGAAAEDFVSSFGADDAAALKEHLAKVPRQPAAGIAEGFAATLVAIKIKEALATGQKVEIKPELYELA